MRELSLFQTWGAVFFGGGGWGVIVSSKIVPTLVQLFVVLTYSPPF